MMAGNHNKVAIILLNWNSYDDCMDCIASINNISYPNYHIYLVDNDSQDQSLDRLKKDLHDQANLTFVESSENTGFAGGNNLGIQRALDDGYEYFWMLNVDTVIDREALSALMEAITKDDNIGIVGSKIYYYNSSKVVWFAGGVINTYTGFTKHIGIKEVDNGQFEQATACDYITGCSLLFRRQMLADVGYMNEDYFLYFEETDWNIRARNKGWKILFVPSSIVYHKVSLSTGGENNRAPFVTYYDIRNAFVMIKRTQPKAKVLFAMIYMFWKVFKQIVKMVVKKQNRKQERVWYIRKGVLDAFTNRMGKHHPPFV